MSIGSPRLETVLIRQGRWPMPAFLLSAMEAGSAAGEYTDVNGELRSTAADMTLLSRRITEKTILKVLVSGFVVVFLTTLTAGLVGVRNLRSINEQAANLVEELRLTSNLIARIQNQLATQSAIIRHLSRAPEAIDSEAILKLAQEANHGFARISAHGENAFEEKLWGQLDTASQAFTAEARRCLERKDGAIAATRSLFQRHEELVTVTSALINLSYGRALQAQAEIGLRSRSFVRQALYTVGACLVIAIVLAMLTLKLAVRLLRKMESQSLELSRVSWHLLENQEATARRFSHELHDELGQSLTALKANLTVLASSPESAPERLRDCVNLIDDSIDNVREMSRLLHPRILDDFGLDAALRSLVERHANRTRLEIRYESNIERRLPLDTATHLYRIAQEALTNVVKHSRATHVNVRLWKSERQVMLSIEDNGIGLSGTGGEHGTKGLGLVAMAARARHLGGQVKLGRTDGGGLRVEVGVPIEGEYKGE